jgi:hypothetical protein
MDTLIRIGLAGIGIYVLMTVGYWLFMVVVGLIIEGIFGSKNGCRSDDHFPSQFGGGGELMIF